MTKPQQNSSIWSCVRRRRNGKCRRANGARRKPSSPSCSKTGSSWHDGQPAPHTRFLIVPIAASVSMVGRILKSLMERGVVTPIPTLRRRPGGRRFRIIGQTRHAKRLPKGMRATRPGELVQVDTLFVTTAPGRAVKHFTAYDPVAKWTVGLVARRATALCATALLDKLAAEAPFPIAGIQVDGGSEFRAEFEKAC